MRRRVQLRRGRRLRRWFVTSPLAGVGIGWRPEISGYVTGLAAGEPLGRAARSAVGLAAGETLGQAARSAVGLAFVEVIAESVPHHGPLPDGLARLRDRGVPVVPHGVKLSLGGAEPVEPHRVEHFAAVARLTEAPLVSEHIAFVRAGGHEAGHLLPVPRTREAVDAITANAAVVQSTLDVPLALEPIATLVDWPDDELAEAQFLIEILDRTGALLLLDVANVYANAVNRGEDAYALLDALPWERVAYCHVAGGAQIDGLYQDTHTDRVPDDVLRLVAHLAGRLPAVMLERDGRYPPAAELSAELDAIADAAGLDRVTG
ncbi:MAG: DUF692 domain-containing protein [Hamadaea sp.]|nr:DUF692 domain-containing protein [Hamadaea sp.]